MAKAKSELLTLLDKSCSVGISAEEKERVEELINSTPKVEDLCRMTNSVHLGRPEKSIGDTGLCSHCCKYRLNNYLPKASVII